ncbi:MAG: hypothetical protein K0M50_02855 [Prolixibacteraceae bacterium]|nr:hypothetical protein [Prolixibacteraceae bacterium]
MKNIVILLVFSILCLHSNAQTLYADIFTPGLLATAGSDLRNRLDETNENLSAINRAQLAVAGTLVVANDLQNKVLKGLNTVSGVVKDAITVKYIGETVQDIFDEIKETKDLVSDHPEFAVFAAKGASDFFVRATALAAEVTNVLTSGETNLMNAGDRYKLLNHIYLEVRVLRANAFQIKHSVKWAIRAGFWKSLSPFKTWVNQDRMIMDEIMKNVKRL